jgi:uncharacterized protein (TIRG00374 family)
LLLATAAFFGYRSGQLGFTIYPVFIALFGGVALLGLVDRLAARWQSLTLNLGISLVFLDLVFAEIDLSQVGETLATANYWMLLPAIFFVMLHLYFRTLRAQWLLKPMGEVGFWPTFRALVIGITGNTVLPARAGEFLRAYVLGRATGLSKTGVFATLVVERIFDGLTVLLFLLIIIIFGVRDERFQLFGLLGGLFYVGALAGLIVFIVRRDWIDTLVKRRLPEDLAQPILELLDGFASGLSVLKNPRQLGMVTFWNFFTWITTPISFWFTLLAFDFGSPVPWQAPVLMLPALGIALSVPGPPGGVGLFQTAVALTLELTFADLPKVANFEAVVGAVGIVLHLSQFGPEVLLGVISFVIEGLSAADIQAGQRIQAGQATAEESG